MTGVLHAAAQPLYLQIYQRIRDDILAGVYPYNSRLPSKRLLAEKAGVSTITVEHAYALLCEEGYAEARERSGFWVIFRPADGFAGAGDRHRPPAPTPAPTDTGTGLSVALLSRTMRRVLSDYQERILERTPNGGCAELRLALCRYLARNRGIQVEPEQIVIGSGAEYLYGQIIDLFGRDKLYAIESPSYEKLEPIYQVAGVRYERLPLAGDGIDSRALAASHATVLHTTPYRSVPSGVTASASKRHEYIHWSGQKERFIIESDYDSEFAVSSQPMETLFALSEYDNVIYSNTFSKTISPSMRVGYMVLPRRLVQPFQEKLGFYSCSVPTFEQFVLAELLNSGDFERHINRVRRQKRRALAAGDGTPAEIFEETEG